LQDDYRIGVQDVLDVVVFQVEDLSRTVRVDGDGTILLPLIGEVPARGRTTKELSDDLAIELGRKYMNDPRVTVTVKESASQRVTVDGAVIQPGILSDIWRDHSHAGRGLARGPGALADLRQVAIFRTSGTQRTTAVFDLTAIREGRAADPRILANDIVIVETSGARKFLRNLSRRLSAASAFYVLLAKRAGHVVVCSCPIAVQRLASSPPIPFNLPQILFRRPPGVMPSVSQSLPPGA
jgi:polysaccharide export outer membrane protein